ncbi:WGR domain-containing protein [Methylotuvimicrobium buryatense]|uniref:WGR domain-containing protein n=1 Tax=Methylotuvimicrobium buryatense TaxID=95641 RepID=UPI000348B1E4|nr:WGR domain-containing protein [Methylotuvimicrobium buryatense]
MIPRKTYNRFYQLFVTRGILGDWSVVREWGRAASPGAMRKDWFDTEPEVLEAAEKVFDAKKKKGLPGPH